MPELRCKFCGKILEIPEKKLTFTHDCGVEIVIPSRLTDARIEKFNAGYSYLRNLDFKKAESCFREIISARAKNDYEANWCLALCEFKVENFYNSVKKKFELHTHYAGNENFTDSEYYKTAILNAPAPIKAVYRKQGKEINNIIATKKIANEKRNKAFSFVNRGKFDEADNLFNEILEISTREPMAYIGKLLCELNLRDIAKLTESEISLTQYKNFNNALHCADRETKIFLNSYNMAVSERLNQEDFFPEEDIIHTLDEMEISADDTFEITTADKAIGALNDIRYRLFALGMFFKEHIKGIKILIITLCALLVLALGAFILSLTVFAPTDYYEVGNELFQSGNILDSAENLALAKAEPKAVELLKSDEFYKEINSLYNDGKIREAVHLANLCGITSTDIETLDRLINETVASGEHHSLSIKTDKTVQTATMLSYSNYGEINVALWSDIISVATGTYHSVGLTSDGHVVVAGDNRFGQCDVSEWEDIIAISAGSRHTVGLKSDGTVVATQYLGENNKGQSNVSSWKNVIAISAGDDFTIGLLSDGTVVSTLFNEEIVKWKDIVSISAGYKHVLALTSDGKVLSAILDNATDFGQTNVSEWSDVIAISAGYKHSIAIKADGTLLSTDNSVPSIKKASDCSAGNGFTVALTQKKQFIATPEINIKNWIY